MGVRRNRKKSSKPRHSLLTDEDLVVKGPRVLVINRGSVGPVVQQLMADIKIMLAPHVVNTIKVLRSSGVKELVAASKGLHISHAVVFTRTDIGLYMKLVTFPAGPTITFSVQHYSLQRDLVASQRRALNVSLPHQQKPACLMMNNLQPRAGPNHLQVVANTMLQLFPQIQPGQLSSSSIKRCCLLHYSEDSQVFELRHYSIHLAPSTAARLVNKLVNKNKIPNLGAFEGIEDAMLRDGVLSESEVEDDCKVPVTESQPQQSRRRTHTATTITTAAVKMRDCGPRITFKLHKVQTGLLDGDVLYNAVLPKTPAEAAALKEQREARKKEKALRKNMQATNVDRKKEQASEHRLQCLAGMPEEQRARALQRMKDEDEGEDDYEADHEQSDVEDDAEYYRDEVGENPDDDTFTTRKRELEKGNIRLDTKRRKQADDEHKVIEDKKGAAKLRYKLLDERKKKRPRSFGKRMVKMMKQKANQRHTEQAEKRTEKAKVPPPKKTS